MSAVGESSLAAAWHSPLPGRSARRRPRVQRQQRCIRIGLLGYGQVGQAVAELAARPIVQERLHARGLSVQCVGAVVRDFAKARRGPVLPLVSALPAGASDVIVEVLGGVEPARTLVAHALRARVAVVTANKSLVAAHGPQLRELALRHRTGFACDAAVLAGVPFLGALARRPLVSAARRFVAILNGTSHYVACEIARGASWARALEQAVARGYAEPDSSADTSGRDAAEKLAILLHLSGCDVDARAIARAPLEVLTPELLSGAGRLGGVIKPVALAELEAPHAGAWVGPAFVPREHPFSNLDGVANALQLTSQAGDTLTFSGPGAGPEATALTILDDIVELHEIASNGIGLLSNQRPEARTHRTGVSGCLQRPPHSAWFFEIRSAGAHDTRGLANHLKSFAVPALQICAHAGAVIGRTIPATWDVIQTAANSLRADGATVVVLPSVT